MGEIYNNDIDQRLTVLIKIHFQITKIYGYKLAEIEDEISEFLSSIF